MFSGKDALDNFAATIIKEQIEAHSASVLGLATGSTPLGLYDRLQQMHRHGLDFSGVTTFNLDEYLGLSGDHPASYRHYMQEHLFAGINVPKSNIHIPDGTANDVEAECAAYEKAILAAGGIDIQVTGIGHNGHIGFNEPGTEFGCTTHVVTLDESTRQANARFFDNSLEQVPRQAVTMGIKTIMQARKILLLASGKDKAEAVAGALEGSVTTRLPASVLQLHPRVVVLLDEAAAAGLAHDNPMVKHLA